MREQIQRRLEALKKEFNTGRARATELQQQQTTLHQTLLRISGAIQVLEEELKAESEAPLLNSGMSCSDADQTLQIAANGSLDRVTT